jgi:hypothetical protein
VTVAVFDGVGSVSFESAEAVLATAPESVVEGTS